MDMNYVMIHLGWTEETKELTEAEKGRLIDAIVAYAADGSLPENLRGGERYLFPVYRSQVDRDRDAYEQRLKAQRENGSKGGRPPKNPNNPRVFSKNPNNPRVFSETQITQYKGKCKGECKGKDKGEDFIPLCPPSELFKIHEDHNEILNAWEQAGFQSSEIIRGKLIELYSQYGLDKMVQAITTSALASPRQPMQYLIGVLKIDGKPKPAVPAAPAQPARPADFQGQRKWTDDDDDMEEFMRRDIKI